jgi:hypothetical protein
MPGEKSADPIANGESPSRAEILTQIWRLDCTGIVNQSTWIAVPPYLDVNSCIEIRSRGCVRAFPFGEVCEARSSTRGCLFCSKSDLCMVPHTFELRDNGNVWKSRPSCERLQSGSSDDGMP